LRVFQIREVPIPNGAALSWKVPLKNDVRPSPEKKMPAAFWGRKRRAIRGRQSYTRT